MDFDIVSQRCNSTETEDVLSIRREATGAHTERCIMSLIFAAHRAGIFGRAMEISDAALERSTQQIRSGAGRIRAAMYRRWKR